MKKCGLVIFLVGLVAMTSLGCKKGAKEAATPGVKERSTAAETETAKSDFDRVVEIFKGFEEVVDKNKNNPPAGVKACQEYTEKYVPRIKSLEGNIKGLETKPEFIDEMIETNNQIKEISDRVTKIVTENYGVEGADVLLLLSDMALARL